MHFFTDMPQSLDDNSLENVRNNTLNKRLMISYAIRSVFFGSSILIVVLMLTVFIFTATQTSGFLFHPNRIYEVLVGQIWEPTDHFDDGQFGSSSLLYGSLLVSIVAAIGIPIGICVGIYLSYIAPSRVRNIVKPLIETISIFPSVVIGFFAIQHMSHKIKDATGANTGLIALTASMCLAWMIIPLVASLTDDAIRSVPKYITNTSLAMGATRWETLSRLVLPEAKSSIFAAGILGFGRIIGETMVVLMVTGNAPVISSPPGNVLKPVYTLPAAIASEHLDAVTGGAEYQVLFMLGLELLFIAFILNAFSRMVVKSPQLTSKIFKPFNWLVYVVVTLPLQGGKKTISVILKNKKEKENIKKNQLLTLSNRQIKMRKIKQNVYYSIFVFLTISVISFIFIIPYYLLIDGWDSLINPKTYYSSPNITDVRNGIWGMKPYIIGTLLVIFLSSLIALPISTAMSIYLKHYAKEGRFTEIIRSSLINLASIPSVVIGLFGMGIFVRLLNWQFSLLGGAITLSIMMIPISVTTCLEALDQVPPHFQEAALALGATKWEAIKSHNIRYSLSNMITGYLFSISRVIGETAPIMLTVAVMTTKAVPTALTGQGVAMLPFLIYYNVAHSTRTSRLEWAGCAGIILLALAICINITGHIIRTKLETKY